MARQVIHHEYDAVIVGAGGAGLMAALEASKRCRVAVVSKLYPTRSHTGTAQGGIGAALGNLEPDSWEWHMFDTVKGGDYLPDQDAVEVMCREAIDVVYSLEHMGLPFNRTPEGKIDQRRFGGHTMELGKAPVRRACYAADRTGHMILQTLYQQCIKQGVAFFDEFHLTDVLVSGGRCAGVVALCLATGELHCFRAKAVLLATGGFGRMFKVTSNAHTLTGDGCSIVFRRGVPLEDMEFFQFHPTGIYKLGILVTEGARGEGGVLLNGKGERFMERYAPTMKDLAPRDMISRAIYREVQEGRGVDGKDYVHLDLTKLDPDVVERKLPDITDFVRTYLGVDPVKELVPVQPTAHYAMGGIPTNTNAQVVADAKNSVLTGLYAAGECACVSVHGGNRLGTNSLVDIVVFGRRGGRHIAESVGKMELPPLPSDALSRSHEEIGRLTSNLGGESAAAIRTELQQVMMDRVSVYREETGLKEALATISTLRSRYRKVEVEDRSLSYNTELQEALELGYLLDLAWATTVGALARTESRGAHSREDFPKRDDANWLKHSLAFATDGNIKLDYKPVSITRFQPKERIY
ncbi:MAG: succinate dehydrogenase flavoprotein subunit [Candidatus Omnitrophica bacterium CG11_big_fil_rev_8_21_14_0_20_63_9]|nr:MAG: succinate dehydrogenase flavoprotein subunit [Candidatus Omnitrophica bacterium CG11_big_fil_rev_8_21_14_0_20_63_9]